MKRLFISQPMRGKTREEIMATRAAAIEAAERHLGVKVEAIESFFTDAPAGATPLWYLAKSIELLATADVVYMAYDWKQYRGCRIEYACAVEYDIPVIEE